VDGEIEDCIRTEYRRLVGAVAVVTGSTADLVTVDCEDPGATPRLVAALDLAPSR
jgi:hypothetical protein